ncbi:MAG: ABC transporter ATP-binding protein [Bacteroidales bacterium]
MLLITNNLSKQYKRRDTIVDALKDVSLEIEEGSFVTITGPSGSGKTTLLLALSGLIRPTSGQIIINNKHLENASDSELSNFRKENVGFILQSFSLIPYLSALQNVMVPLALINHSKQKQIEIAREVIELVGLGDRMNHLPRELSAGQQQRVAIARAVVNKPKIIFADEPTGNLDPDLSTEILSFMKNINKDMGITILMVTHSPVAADFGNLKIKLSNGELSSNLKHHIVLN